MAEGDKTVAELREELRALDLPTTGNKAELVDRLNQAKTVDELKDELRDEGLPVSGTKDELIERLEGGDAGSGDEEGAAEGAGEAPAAEDPAPGGSALEPATSGDDEGAGGAGGAVPSYEERLKRDFPHLMKNDRGRWVQVGQAKVRN